jgi:hypothetical protein
MLLQQQRQQQEQEMQQQDQYQQQEQQSQLGDMWTFARTLWNSYVTAWRQLLALKHHSNCNWSRCGQWLLLAAQPTLNK